MSAFRETETQMVLASDYSPNTQEEDIFTFFRLTETDHQFLEKLHPDTDRLGCAVQLCALRHLGYIPDRLKQVPAAAVEFLAQQLSVSAEILSDYGNRALTRVEHLREIESYLGFHSATQKETTEVARWLVDCAVEDDRPDLLRQLLCRRLSSLRIIRPAPALLDGAVNAVRQQAESEKWCRNLALDTAETLRRMTSVPTHQPVRERFTEVFEQADRFVAACPVKMGAGGNLDLLYWLCEHLRARRIVETGVAYGWSSLAFLLSLSARRDGILVSTDLPYPEFSELDQTYVGCVVPPELRSQWQTIKGPDREGLPKALSQLGQIDMCHYDSDKSYAGRMWAYQLLWRALRVGGYLISDDIGDNLAFKHFCGIVRHSCAVVHMPGSLGMRYIGVLVKERPWLHP